MRIFCHLHATFFKKNFKQLNYNNKCTQSSTSTATNADSQREEEALLGHKVKAAHSGSGSGLTAVKAVGDDSLTLSEAHTHIPADCAAFRQARS